jgi:hypothetical protein
MQDPDVHGLSSFIGSDGTNMSWFVRDAPATEPPVALRRLFFLD